jgi:tetratricopeptide (TPR) repeat protein
LLAFPQLADKKIYTRTGMELIEIYSAAGDLSQTAAVVDKLREHDPTDVSVLYAAYRVYSDLASDAMISMSLVAPDSAQMHQIMEHELEQQGNRAGTIAQYREALKLASPTPGLCFELAEVLNNSAEAADNDEAAKEYHDAIQANPQDEKAE